MINLASRMAHRKASTFPPEMPLLWVLRDVVGLTGDRIRLRPGAVLAAWCRIDGEPVRSCQTQTG
jgi:aerobic-type carbon monoxide dehydrogenase small subunit (CoxS/CutS family)